MGLGALSWHGLLSLMPAPPLSPHLLLLPLPRDVNSLKLLIKNIVLSPPKICDFPLRRRDRGKGVAGREWRSSLPGSPWRNQGNQVLAQRRHWLPPALGHHPWLPSSAEGGISEDANPGCHSQIWGRAPAPCMHSHHVPQNHSRPQQHAPICTASKAPCSPVSVL